MRKSAAKAGVSRVSTSRFATIETCSSPTRWSPTKSHDGYLPFPHGDSTHLRGVDPTRLRSLDPMKTPLEAIGATAGRYGLNLVAAIPADRYDCAVAPAMRTTAFASADTAEAPRSIV